MKHLKIFALIAALFCTACSALSFYPYKQADVTSPHAKLTGMKKNTGRHDVVIYVRSIDGLDVGYHSYNKSFRIKPGAHFIAARILSTPVSGSFFSGSDTARVKLIRFNAKPGSSYRVDARVTDDIASAYIVDEAGRVVSNRVKGNFLPTGTYKSEVYELAR